MFNRLILGRDIFNDPRMKRQRNEPLKCHERDDNGNIVATFLVDYIQFSPRHTLQSRPTVSRRLY